MLTILHKRTALSCHEKTTSLVRLTTMQRPGLCPPTTLRVRPTVSPKSAPNSAPLSAKWGSVTTQQNFNATTEFWASCGGAKPIFAAHTDTTPSAARVQTNTTHDKPKKWRMNGQSTKSSGKQTSVLTANTSTGAASDWPISS